MLSFIFLVKIKMRGQAKNREVTTMGYHLNNNKFAARPASSPTEDSIHGR
jgi:hypothetical protein